MLRRFVLFLLIVPLGVSCKGRGIAQAPTTTGTGSAEGASLGANVDVADTARGAGPQELPAQHEIRVPQPDSLAPGEFRWAPERAAEGPVLVVVSVPEQMAYVYRNGVEIGRSTVSTGRKGHRTPTGVFQILQKQKRHFSSTYNSAPMPYMERLTWDGIALHAGALPGYPASHGCVRLPLELARLLYGVTAMGGTVVIADDSHSAATLAHPGFLAPVVGPGGDLSFPDAPSWFQPERSDSGPLAIVISSANREVHVLRNGVEIGRAPIDIRGSEPLVPVTYMRTEQLADAPHPFAPGQPFHVWNVVGGPSMDSSLVHQFVQRVRIHPAFGQQLYGVLQTGATIVLTNEPLTPERRRDDMTILAAGDGPPAGKGS